MTDVRTATEDLLEEKPSLGDALEDLLAVDAANDTWTFDDISTDSGTFGELVSCDIVEKHNGEYRLRDREAVEEALGVDDSMTEMTDSESGGDRDLPSISVPEVDRVAAAGLAGALALVVLFRVLPFSSVFRTDDVVLSGNDPYYYRYLVHQLLAESGGAFDFSVLSSLPDGVSHGEPLFVATLWWISSLFGGETAVGSVLAWYPVVAAILTGLFVYLLTVRVTGDKRVGIAAVALLAVIPAHGFRTSLGFADHHAFDYPWLALTALAAVALLKRDLRERRTWAWVIALGVGVGGQTLAWEAGPLLLVPLALFAVAVVPSWLREDRSPLVAGGPLLAGLTLGAVLVGAAHLAWGWHTTAVVVAPALLVVGTVSVFGLGTTARRFEVSTRAVVGVEVAGAIVGFALLGVVVPAFTTGLDRGVEFLLETEGIAETSSLLGGQLGNIVSPIFLFGFALFLAVPYISWASWRCYRRHAPAWLVACVYAWTFLVLGLLQVRFAGQLALFVAFFGGLGFVHVAAWIDLIEYPDVFDGGATTSRPDEGDEDDELEWPARRAALYTAGMGLGVGSLGGLLTPARQAQLTIDESMYEAARFMRGYSDERGWDYPDNYVLSRWGRNRVYNWFVNGESQSYGYALSNFEEFVTSTDGQEWYDRLRDRVGFVVVGDGLSIDSGGRTIYERLRADTFGLETDHFRAVWAGEDDSRRVYTLVPGARVVGAMPDGEDVTIDGQAEIDGVSRTISTTIEPGENGLYDERVPLPGAYTFDGWEATVSEQDVFERTVFSPFEGEAHWSFEEASGDWVYDQIGGLHGRIHDAEWAEDGRDRPALEFEGRASDYVEIPMESLQEFTIGLWAYPIALGVSEENDYRDIVRTEKGSILIFEQTGRISFRLPGTSIKRVVGSGVATDTWTHVAVSFDGATRTIYVDGERAAQDDVSVGALEWGSSMRFGNRYSTPSRHGYAGRLKDVRLYESARSDITTLFGLE
jgi:dolichyl-diphosphooligosaccharide--protein glycosyltransferase